ncbi:DUF485 domain-containing protein [Virgibacillus sp. W0181]|uniref:DUF485 domain-containing protein n=1 Tax=Virgibacillus sp. W0181 TaxID=3391581 RepID=UPI003F46AC6E
MHTQEMLFEKLLKRKKRFVIIAVVFFMSFYFLLPLSITFFPKIMNEDFFHGLTPAWMLAFAQFIVVWSLGALYLWKAKQFNVIIEDIKKAGH